MNGLAAICEMRSEGLAALAILAHVVIMPIFANVSSLHADEPSIIVHEVGGVSYACVEFPQPYSLEDLLFVAEKTGKLGHPVGITFGFAATEKQVASVSLINDIRTLNLRDGKHSEQIVMHLAQFKMLDTLVIDKAEFSSYAFEVMCKLRSLKTLVLSSKIIRA